MRVYGFGYRAIFFNNLLKIISKPQIFPIGQSVNSSFQPSGTNLYCTSGIWSRIGFSYTFQWRANGINIALATNFSYTLTNVDIGKTIDCVVGIQGSNVFIPSANSIIAVAVPNFFVDTILTTADSTIITSDKY
jgi:hypothetical protein